MSLKSKNIIKQLLLDNLSATRQLAEKLSALLKIGDIIGFEGNLGVGKTEFCRALIHGLGYKEDVPSPTFSLVQIYEPPMDDLKTAPVWHLDLYRLDQPQDVLELGIDDGFDTAITLIEWPDRMGRYLPDQHLQILLSMDDHEGGRKMIIRGDDHWKARLKELNLDDE